MTTTDSPWGHPRWSDPGVASRARDVAGGVDGSLRLAVDLEDDGRAIGTDTWRTFRTLATLGSVDLTTARVAEPHLDAAAILDQAGRGTSSGTTWGVYAASPPGTSLEARRGTADTWRLTGVKPWCSLADRLTSALITATLEDGRPGLFEVGLRQKGVAVEPTAWVPRGLREVVTSTVTFDGVDARPVGDPGWYLDRPGFAWGGIGVAAVWFGAAAAVAGRLWTAARSRTPDQVALVHLGSCDAALDAALGSLRLAAEAVDDGAASGPAGAVLAARVRAQVARCAEEVVTTVGHALGPGPLAHDAEHAGRVADLTLYLRQHHAERDLAVLGRLVTAATEDTVGAGS